MNLDPAHPTQSWFTEIFRSEGSAFSLRIKSHLHHEQSKFQTIDIYDTETFGKLMVIDHCIMLTGRDNFIYHEMMSHPVLYTHPNPQKVAIIGGGDCGTLKEVLKHPSVSQVTQIDIDERVTRLSEQFFPELCSSNSDERAHIIFEDGIEWIKQQPLGSLDIIIIDSTDPVGPAEGLFAREFYEDCRKALSSEGILVQQSESPLYHTSSIIEGIHRDMLAAGFNFRQTLPFPQPVYPSGWWSCTLASQKNLDHFRFDEALNKSFETTYYNANLHSAAKALPEFMLNTLNRIE